MNDRKTIELEEGWAFMQARRLRKRGLARPPLALCAPRAAWGFAALPCQRAAPSQQRRRCAAARAARRLGRLDSPRRRAQHAALRASGLPTAATHAFGPLC
jgi:hypothetical protein